MLRVTQCKNARAAKRYFVPSRAGYYAGEGLELPGQWGGRAAERLGLSGEVDKASFDALCEGRHPVTGGKLTVRLRTDRTSGYDLNFHCPKSVSLLYAMTGEADILDAFRWAVGETMREIEARMQTRVRQGRQCFDRTVGNMAWAEHIHLTARPVGGESDPHLHAHLYCFNAVFDPVEQRWKAGQFRDIKQEAPRFQARFRTLLAGRLAELGYGIAWKGDVFEIMGLSSALLRKFSRRTEQIERLADALGLRSGQGRDKLGEITREPKRLDTALLPDLRQRWRKRLTPEERAEIALAGLKGRRIDGPAYRHAHDTDPTDAGRQAAHDRIMRRQRLAVYGQASQAPALPAPPRQRQGHGR